MDDIKNQNVRGRQGLKKGQSLIYLLFTILNIIGGPDQFRC